MVKRFIIIVLDSFGIGAMPDADRFGDTGSNTLAAVAATGKLRVPHLASLGLFNIEGAIGGKPAASPLGAFGRMAEASPAKDTTVGHWEIAGLIARQAFPVYPQGFPAEVTDALTRATGYTFLCNKPYSGTQLLVDYGEEHIRTGKPILYTSADSVLQIAAHEDVLPLDKLYALCLAARKILQGPHGVGRVIARPFTGAGPPFTRTANRRDFSLPPPRPTLLDQLGENGLDAIAVGKISDIFAGQGVTRSFKTKSNDDGMEQALALLEEDFTGLCFVNLVDFDMLYGHRNDAEGYAEALNSFDRYLGLLLDWLSPGDVLLLTADHGCDPSTPSTDHSREYVPLLVCGNSIVPGTALGTRSTFADAAATVLDCFGLENRSNGHSFWASLSGRT